MKKSMMGVLALGTFIAAANSPLQAQTPRRDGGAEPKLDEKIEMLTERLELNEDQAAAVRGILETQSEKHHAVPRAGGRDGARAKRHAAMQVIYAETTGMLAEVLSEEQVVEFQKFHAEMRQQKQSSHSESSRS